MDPVPDVDGDITYLLRAWSAGRDEAFGELLSAAYKRLRSIAGACMSHERPDHTLQATALISELYLRFAGPGWRTGKTGSTSTASAPERCAGF